MEQRNLLIAIVLSLGILIGFQFIFQRLRPPPPPQGAPSGAPPSAASAPSAPAAAAAPKAPGASAAPAA